MPNILIPDWSDLVFLKWNDATFSAAAFPQLALVIPSLKLSDARGDFLRIADDGRGVDPGRELLSEQGDAIRNITGTFSNIQLRGKNINTGGAISGTNAGLNGNNSAGADISVNYFFDASRQVPTANENRPRNIAFNFLVRAK